MKRILLFGRAGSGKSTVATMLYKGDIDSINEFNISDSPCGATIEAKIDTSKDGEWEIYDTVGLGEPARGSIPNRVAKKMIVKLLKETNRGFYYICMLKREGRFDDLDKTITAFIYTLFSKEDLDTNLFYIIASEKEHWIQDNKNKLSDFINTDRAITVDFPGFQARDNHKAIKEKTQRRKYSLARLKTLLLNTDVRPVYPKTAGFTRDIDYQKLSDTLYRILSCATYAFSIANTLLEIISKINI